MPSWMSAISGDFSTSAAVLASVIATRESPACSLDFVLDLRFFFSCDLVRGGGGGAPGTRRCTGVSDIVDVTC